MSLRRNCLASHTGPDYRQVADLIRDKIASGEWPIGTAIPSTPALRNTTGLSLTTVRRAVQQLQTDGILEGHPGKGVFVKATPAEADSANVTVDKLGDQVGDLREQYDDLRLRVAHLETELMDLKAGQGLPQGGEHDQENQPARRRPAR